MCVDEDSPARVVDCLFIAFPKSTKGDYNVEA